MSWFSGQVRDGVQLDTGLEGSIMGVPFWCDLAGTFLAIPCAFFPRAEGASGNDAAFPAGVLAQLEFGETPLSTSSCSELRFPWRFP
jgi:hypothetical protein